MYENIFGGEGRNGGKVYKGGIMVSSVNVGAVRFLGCSILVGFAVVYGIMFLNWVIIFLLHDFFIAN